MSILPCMALPPNDHIRRYQIQMALQSGITGARSFNCKPFASRMRAPAQFYDIFSLSCPPHEEMPLTREFTLQQSQLHGQPTACPTNLAMLSQYISDHDLVIPFAEMCLQINVPLFAGHLYLVMHADCAGDDFTEYTPEDHLWGWPLVGYPSTSRRVSLTIAQQLRAKEQREQEKVWWEKYAPFISL